MFWLSTVAFRRTPGWIDTGADASGGRSGLGAPKTGKKSAPPLRSSRSGEVAAVAANLLVFVNYSIWVVSLPLLGAEKFGFRCRSGGDDAPLRQCRSSRQRDAHRRHHSQGRRRTGAGDRFRFGGVGLLLVPIAPSGPWLLAPMALYAIGQVAGNSSAGDLILRLGGGGGRAVGAVRFSSDVGLVAGPAAVGALADAAGVAAPFAVLGVVALAAMAAVTLVARKPPRPGFDRG